MLQRYFTRRRFEIVFLFSPENRLYISTDDKLVIFFLFFSEKKALTFHANCLAGQFASMS